MNSKNWKNLIQSIFVEQVILKMMVLKIILFQTTYRYFKTISENNDHIFSKC